MKTLQDFINECEKLLGADVNQFKKEEEETITYHADSNKKHTMAIMKYANKCGYTVVPCTNGTWLICA